MTNLNKNREEIIYELLLSLNNGNSCCADERVELAIAQYDSLVKNKIITEQCEHEYIFDYEFDELKRIKYTRKCTKCGATKTF